MKGTKRDRPCLFLDRDGVINNRVPNDYVKTWDEFIFAPMALSVLRQLRKYFHPIIVVTNQQGIGKGVMTVDQLEAIHQKMRRVVRKHGGKIDAVLYCPDLANPPSPCRKPNIGMGLMAVQIFPDIRFDYAVMVGDTDSDVLFGKQLGMVSVLLVKGKIDPGGQADYVFNDLQDFYLNFAKKKL